MAMTAEDKAQVFLDCVVKISRRYTVQPEISFGDKMNSGIINGLFYPIFVHAKKFYATNECISYGKCAKVCLLNNIHIEDGKPVWEKKCTQCMVCICHF